MTETQHDMDRDVSSRRRRLTAGLVSLTALAAVIFFSFGSRGAPGVTPPDGGGGGGGAASCIRFDLELLAQQQLAFDGTVTAIDGDSVTFAVGHWYRGSGDSITLTAYGLGGILSADGSMPDFAVGSRYLVSGADGVLTACGYSQAYDDAAAADWASAFGG